MQRGTEGSARQAIGSPRGVAEPRLERCTPRLAARAPDPARRDLHERQEVADRRRQRVLVALRPVFPHQRTKHCGCEVTFLDEHSAQGEATIQGATSRLVTEMTWR